MRVVAGILALAPCLFGCGGRQTGETPAIPEGAGGASESATGGAPGSGGAGGAAPKTGCTADGFCLASPAVTANRLNAVWGASASDVWAVGDHGVIVHFDGRVWLRVGSRTTERLLGVSGTFAHDVWVVGENGTTIHSDGNDVDLLRGPETALHLTAVHAIDTSSVWVASGTLTFPVGDEDYGAVFHFDGGKWRDVRPTTTRSFHRALWATSSEDVWLTGDHTYHFDGKTWAPAGSARGVDIWSDLGMGAWVPDAISDRIWHVEGTTTTTSLDGAANRSILGIWGASATDVWAVGSSGFVSHYDGNGWVELTSGTTRTLTAVWGSSPTDVWAVGELGTIIHYDGTSWSSSIPDREPDRSPTFNAIWGASDDEQWIAGSDGVFAYDGYAQTRASGPGTEGPPAAYAAIWGSARDDIVAVGSSGAIAEFDGEKWRNVDSPTTESFTAVWGDSRKMLALGRREGIVRMGSDPWQSEPVTGGAGGPLSAVWGATSDDIWVTSFISGVLGHFVDGRWAEENTSVFARALWGSAEDDIWAVGGKVPSRYDGALWTSQPQAIDLSGVIAVSGCSRTNVWAVGEAGKIVHYDGATWSVVDSGTSNTLHGVRCSPGGVWIVGEGAVILKKRATGN